MSAPRPAPTSALEAPTGDVILVRALRHRWGGEGGELRVREWRVRRGERVALVGPSGVGKTTLLMILSGLVAPQEGEVWVGGAPLHAMSEGERRAWRGRSVGLLAQDFALLEHLSALDNVKLPASLGLRDGSSGEAEALLKAAGVWSLSARAPSALSQGERQRVAACRALLGAPAFLVADEPTAHLDPERARALLSLLSSRARDALVVVTHDLTRLGGFTQVVDVSAWRVGAEGGEAEGDLSRALNHTAHLAPPPPEPPPEPPLGPPLPRRGAAWLGARALWRYRGRTLALTLALALTGGFPVGLTLLSDRYERSLRARAQTTPLVLGAPGSRYDLALGALYLSGAKLKDLPWRTLSELETTLSIKARSLNPVPLHLKWTAGGAPLVGTTPEYYEARGLRAAQGRLPTRLGEAAVGAEAARALSLGVGSERLTDQDNLYDLASTYPIALKVVGVLSPTGTPDDAALFCDIKTAWVIEGLGHGHGEVKGEQGAHLVLSQRLNASGAHFHGDLNTFPLSAIALFPTDERAASLFKSRARRRADWAVLRPSEVVNEVLSVVLRLEGALHTLSALALTLTLALGALVSWLSAQLRAAEWAALGAIGVSRGGVARLALAELGWVVGVAVALGGAGVWALSGMSEWVATLIGAR